MKVQCGCAKIITNGVAPAGGCTVFVICMAAIEALTPMASEYQVLPRRYAQSTAMMAAIRWPPIMLRGWANGLSITPKASTQVAPKGAIIKGMSVVCVSNVTAEMAMSAPRAEERMCDDGGEPGTCSRVLNLTI